jgi:hypothetical protein
MYVREGLQKIPGNVGLEFPKIIGKFLDKLVVCFLILPFVVPDVD